MLGLRTCTTCSGLFRHSTSQATSPALFIAFQRLLSLEPRSTVPAGGIPDFCLTVMFLLKQKIARSFVVDTVNEFFMLKTNHYAIMQIKYNFVKVCGAA